MLGYDNRWFECIDCVEQIVRVHWLQQKKIKKEIMFLKTYHMPITVFGSLYMIFNLIFTKLCCTISSIDGWEKWNTVSLVKYQRTCKS